MAEITLTDANFDAEVLKNTKPVLWIFGRRGAARVRCSGQSSRSGKEMAGKAVVGKVNVDENRRVATIRDYEYPDGDDI